MKKQNKERYIRLNIKSQNYEIQHSDNLYFFKKENIEILVLLFAIIYPDNFIISPKLFLIGWLIGILFF